MRTRMGNKTSKTEDIMHAAGITSSREQGQPRTRSLQSNANGKTKQRVLAASKVNIRDASSTNPSEKNTKTTTRARTTRASSLSEPKDDSQYDDQHTPEEPRTKPQDPGIPLSESPNATSVSSNSTMTSVASADRYKKPHVDNRAKRDGWTCMKAKDQIHDYYWIKPGRSYVGGTMGVDYFADFDDVIEYYKQKDQEQENKHPGNLVPGQKENAISLHRINRKSRKEIPKKSLVLDIDEDDKSQRNEKSRKGRRSVQNKKSNGVSPSTKKKAQGTTEDTENSSPDSSNDGGKRKRTASKTSRGRTVRSSILQKDEDENTKPSENSSSQNSDESYQPSVDSKPSRTKKSLASKTVEERAQAANQFKSKARSSSRVTRGGTSMNTSCTKPEEIEVSRSGKKWNEMYQQLVIFQKQHGHTYMTASDDISSVLNNWVRYQRYLYKNRRETMKQERVQLLEKIGFHNDLNHLSPVYNNRSQSDWEDSDDNDDSSIISKRMKHNDDKWQEMYLALVDFKNQHGHTNVTAQDQNDTPNSQMNGSDSISSGLYNWVRNQRYLYKNQRKTMKKERVKLLEKIGFHKDLNSLSSPLNKKRSRSDWEDSDDNDDSSIISKRIKQNDDKWQEMYLALENFKKQHGHTNVSAKDQNDIPNGLYAWVRNQRYLYKNKKDSIRPERKKLLKKIGFENNTLVQRSSKTRNRKNTRMGRNAVR